MIDWVIDPLAYFFGIEGRVALDRNPGLECNTLLLRLVPWYLYNACPHIQFHTLHGLLCNRSALQISYPYTCVPIREAAFTILLWSFVRPGRGANPRPTPWELDMLTTKSSWRGICLRNRSLVYVNAYNSLFRSFWWRRFLKQ